WPLATELVMKLFRYRFHHGPASAGVHGRHRDTKLGRLHCGPRYGIRNVVKLKIQENLAAACGDFTYDLWARCGEELAADFEHADNVPQLADELQCSLARADVQGDDDLFLHSFICPTMSLIDDRLLCFRNFSKPSRT